MLLEGQLISLAYWQIEEILDLRVGKMKLKIEDLFMVVPAPEGYEGDAMLDTKYGKLRTFFVNESLNIYVLHRSKFKYPVPRNTYYDENGDLIR